jgi:hypothetical protein
MKTSLFTLLSIVVLLLCGTAPAAAAPAAGPEKVILPDGTFFPFWDDQTVYRKTYHVAGRSPQASDSNAGTEEKPLKTIGRAAEIVEPGEKVVIHEGVYRECVSPRRVRHRRRPAAGRESLELQGQRRAQLTQDDLKIGQGVGNASMGRRVAL